ncbi:iron-siderophore ABC transporter substrate-binding protein [Microbacterium aerolatum]|uniref:iron-siderophore ABC transporter substrate-binding protein n=1 Tax=Microbacterium aerolatum TaxID=153731 RepID=UPI002001363D|nr:iron-siderophore ABC transporter substrate-binding protein [Microbacterium aerolatum]MCK3770709.1 iron-siderophore ABC transporter substrate-binding protein [Microbacterium aerolatum]
MRTSRLLALGAAAALAIGLAGCSTTPASPEDGGSNEAAEGSFPVTVTHALGKTTVSGQPERVTTIGWGNQDVALALGIAPVGVDDQTWSMDGSDGLGVYDWTLDAYEALGAQEPVVFSTADGTDFEGVADTQPELILAGYSGLTAEDYETMTAIAPTIAYPDAPWLTPWREVIRVDSEGLGLAEEGTELIASLEEQIADATDDSGFEGKKAAFFYMSAADLSTVSIYGQGDSRTAFLADLGFDLPDLAGDVDTFYEDISAENADQIADVDVIVSYGDGDELLKALQAHPLWSTLEAVKNGAVVSVGSGDAFSGAVTPTALSIPWMLEDYVAMLDDAVALDQ